MTALPSMINPGYLRLMAAYNAEMNRRLYAAAERLTDQQRKADGGAFWVSIHGAFNHILWADRMWLARFQGQAIPPVAMAQSSTLIDDFDTLKAARVEADRAISDWAAGVTDAWLASELSWRSMVLDRDITAPRSLLAMHMFNHQTHHRGQAHALLTRAGEKTGDTDLPFVLTPDVLMEAMR